tara:strand:+ start:791 stop:1147 length:357 start_codon:yes stop_codon:yes gene_type:complete
MKNVFKTNMEFSTTQFDGFYIATNSASHCYVEQKAVMEWEATYEEDKWKQTGLSFEDAVQKFGTKAVRIKKGALNNGDDMVEVIDGFTETKASFDTVGTAIRWLETKVPFSMKLAEFI